MKAVIIAASQLAQPAGSRRHRARLTFVTPHDVHVWYRATEALDDTAIAAAASSLSDDEREQYGRFHFARDARDYAAAHALLRHTLSRSSERSPAEWRFEKTPAGKPLLRDAGAAPVAFSLSHTNGMVACAVTSAAAVGVDVERVDRCVDTATVTARFFAPQEAAELTRLHGDARRARFFDLWTLKEALVKALGTGIASSFTSIAFTVHAGRVTLIAPQLEPDGWQFSLFAPSPVHRLAVAVQLPPSVEPRFIFRSVTDSR